MALHYFRNIVAQTHIFKKLGIYIVLFLLVIPVYALSPCVCKITPTQIIKVNEVRDVYDNLNIYAVVGMTKSDPSSWVQTIISENISITNNFAPVLISNTLGDVVVVWMYIDSFGICQIAASILLHGTTAWYSATVSQGGWDARARIYDGSIDEKGNAIVQWTGINVIDGSFAVLGATSSLSTSTVWSNQFVIG